MSRISNPSCPDRSVASMTCSDVRALSSSPPNVSGLSSDLPQARWPPIAWSSGSVTTTGVSTISGTTATSLPPVTAIGHVTPIADRGDAKLVPDARRDQEDIAPRTPMQTPGSAACPVRHAVPATRPEWERGSRRRWRGRERFVRARHAGRARNSRARARRSTGFACHSRSSVAARWATTAPRASVSRTTRSTQAPPSFMTPASTMKTRCSRGDRRSRMCLPELIWASVRGCGARAWPGARPRRPRRSRDTHPA